MASPVVAGAAAIVRQYFVDHRKYAKPSAALLKATLINGAVWSECKTVQDAETGMPNYHQGYGRLDLSRTVPARTARTDSLSRSSTSDWMHLRRSTISPLAGTSGARR